MNITYKENELITFFDQIGHVIIAEYIDQDDEHIKVKNPMYLAVVPQQSKERPGQIEFHFETPAWLFRDFMADHNAPLIINLRKDGYSFAESYDLASIVRLRYFNNFSKIVGGAPIPVDADGKPIDPALLKRPQTPSQETNRCDSKDCAAPTDCNVEAQCDSEAGTGPCKAVAEDLIEDAEPCEDCCKK